MYPRSVVHVKMAAKLTWPKLICPWYQLRMYQSGRVKSGNETALSETSIVPTASSSLRNGAHRECGQVLQAFPSRFDMRGSRQCLSRWWSHTGRASSRGWTQSLCCLRWIWDHLALVRLGSFEQNLCFLIHAISFFSQTDSVWLWVINRRRGCKYGCTGCGRVWFHNDWWHVIFHLSLLWRTNLMNWLSSCCFLITSGLPIAMTSVCVVCERRLVGTSRYTR